MNNISEQLLSAIDILTDEKVSQLRFDKTVQATIYSIVDINTGEYKVRYNGNIFAAYSNDTSKTYKVEDQVYISVPEGDFSNRKIILSLVTAISLTEAELTGLANSINEVSPNLVGKDGVYGEDFSTGEEGEEERKTITEPISINCFVNEKKSIWKYTGDTNNLFTQYANNYEYIQVKASFLTKLVETPESGNYGLRLVFKTQEDAVEYKLDTSNFNGLYYSFATYASQSIILKVQKGFLVGLQEIQFFAENFNNNKDTGEKNLFVKDIEIKFVEKIDLSDTNYYLYIAQPQGCIITNKTDYFVQARLILAGQDVISSKATCQWYKRNLDIMVGSAEYDKAAGVGWEKLEGETATTLSLVSNDIKYQGKYKVVVVYDEELPFEAETIVWNNSTEYDYDIEQITNGDRILLRLTNKKSDSDQSLLGKWFISYPDDSYNSITEEKINEIDITDYLKYSYVNFYCAVYNGEDYLGEVDFLVSDSESEDDVIVKYSGESSFRYDANGDITIEDSEKGRTLAATVEWKSGYAVGYSINWSIKDFEIPGEPGSSPANSMIEKPWVDNNNVLHYNIKQKYRNNYNNNTVVVTITTITGISYSFEKEIIFVKDGDQGTNGTTYIAAVRPSDSDNYYLRYNDKYSGSMGLKCTVYRDGEAITNTETEPKKIKYQWSGLNVEFINSVGQEITPSGSEVTIQGTGETKDSRYVMIQITITESSKSTNIYASYPIVTLVQGTKTTPEFDVSNIPQYVKYSSSGRYPSYYNNALEYIVNNETCNFGIESMNEDLIAISDIESKQYLNPVTVFNFSEQKIGVLRVPLNADDPKTTPYLYCPIVMYLDTYGNEAINGWDGTSVQGIYTLDESETATSGRQYYKKVKDKDNNYNYESITFTIKEPYKAKTYYYQTSILAPQIGAGEKDEKNLFTGLIMGQDTGQTKIGLYGYQSGINTFGLKADGSAYFGTANNQITINPDGKINFAIKNNDNIVFSVTNEGELTATSGVIGGWTITDTQFYGGKETGKYVGLAANTDISFYAGSKRPDSSSASSATFYVKKTGEMKATLGTIGGWTIGDSTLTGGGLTLDSGGGKEDRGRIYFGDSYIGRFKGSSTDVFGITTAANVSAVVEAPSNVRIGKSSKATSNITITGNYVVLEANQIQFKAATQSGIKAQFA